MGMCATVRAVQEAGRRSDYKAVSCSHFAHVTLHKWQEVPLRRRDAAFGNHFHLRATRSSQPFPPCQDFGQRRSVGYKDARATTVHRSHGLLDMMKALYHCLNGPFSYSFRCNDSRTAAISRRTRSLLATSL